MRITIFLAAMFTAIGATYLIGVDVGKSREAAKRQAAEIDTHEAINEEPTFNAGDPAARQRLCELLGSRACPVQRDPER